MHSHTLQRHCRTAATLVLMGVCLACSKTPFPIEPTTPDSPGDPHHPTSPPDPPPTGPTSPGVVDVRLNDPPTDIGVGEETMLVATPINAHEYAVDSAVAWSVSDRNLVKLSVKPHGLVMVRGLARGSLTVTATAAGKSTSIPIIIGDPAASLTVTPGNLRLDGANCAEGVVTAELRDANGVVLTGRRPLWTSDDPLVADIDRLGEGTVLPGKAGRTLLWATTGLVRGSATVVVPRDLNVWLCV